MDGTGGDYAEGNKSDREKQVSCGFTHLWKIRNNTEDHREREGKLNGKKSERETNHDRLLTLGNELRVVEGEVGGGKG